MTDYLIDITLKDITDYGRTNFNLFIKIDKNGNVDIKQQYIHLRSGCDGNEYSHIWDYLIINDNIPIPSCMINMLKNLLSLPNNKPELVNSSSTHPLYIRHYENVIESIKILKNDIANSQSKLIELI